MKNRLNTLSIIKFAALTAYLFSQVVNAATTSQLERTAALQNNESQIVEEIKSGFSDLLADLGFPEVKLQAKKQLQHSINEQQAAELVGAATDQLPEYKFKVVIID
ncbi:hypothetical protein [Paraglaciecola sp.]|uniref:hypothetical protein n=1 Tax=Paraglaciecola sp. TaxID=1920173 RepID=UPI0030F3DFB4